MQQLSISSLSWPALLLNFSVFIFDFLLSADNTLSPWLLIPSFIRLYTDAWIQASAVCLLNSALKSKQWWPTLFSRSTCPVIQNATSGSYTENTPAVNVPEKRENQRCHSTDIPDPWGSISILSARSVEICSSAEVRCFGHLHTLTRMTSMPTRTCSHS